MRYEDASHTGAFQGSQPVANDDLDSLPAGSRSAATGNLISGEGTQTGSAGADMAVGAHVTGIAGKSGEDTSFSGGKLSVSGEHGKLSVDADGNYTYQANAGVENVRDRFTYTLADNNGATDTASLIVEIGKTPVVIKANAQQLVPGPDGVVTLPPGVELSDVRVVGRNLVIDMPDGTQLIIIDGAVFVPQLVLGGVEVPSTNLAALLIGQEPQPAAGEAPQSSGGNFDVPVPPLDPGVPLGDLIPPTEYGYTPPEPQEVFDILDREPTIQIQPDGQPASVAAVDSVDEDGLPTRNGGEPEGSDEGADGNPSNNSDPDETTAGTIIIDSPDGVDSVSINGVLVTGVIGQVISGEFGTLTITGFSGQNILYSYTLTDNTSGDNTHDDFSVVLTDDDGDTATATLTIDIIDDVPTARNDTDATVEGVATGNVMTDAAPGDVGDSDTNAADTVGADNASLTAVSGAGGSDSTFEGGLLTVNGQFGVLTIDAQGNYTYTVNPNTGGGGVDVFTYTLTDGDGDTTTATLTITNPDLHPDLPNPEAVLLDDDALDDGNAGGDGDDPDSAGLPGQLAGSGGDGDLDYNFTGINNLPVGFTVNAVDASTVQILQGGTVVLTITLDNETGAFNVVQNNPIDHPVVSATEDNLQFSIGVEVEDSDGDTDPASITINVDDDTPTVNVELNREGGVTVDESGPTGASTIDFGGTEGDDENVAGSGPIGRAVGATAIVDANALFGADGPSGSGLNYALQLGGSDTDLTLTDGSAIELQLINGVIVGMVTEGSHSGEAAFAIAINPTTGITTVELYLSIDHPDVSNPNDSLPLGPNTVDVVVSATDGDGDTATSDPVDVSGLFNFLDDGPSVDAVLSADGPAIVDESPPVADPTIDTGPFAKGDDPDLVGGQAIGSGSTTLLVPDADFGADGPAASDSLTFDLTVINPSSGLTLTDGSAINLVLLPSGVVVGVVSGGTFDGQAAFAISIDASTGTITAELYLSLDHPDMTDPDDILTLAAGSLGAVVTATDGDGDTATSGVIDVGGKISFLDDGPAANDDSASQVGEDNPVTVNVLANDVEGADGVVNGDVSYVDGTLTGTGGLVYNGDGTFTYTPSAGESGDVTFDYQILDGDGDPSVATVTIHLGADSTPQVGTPQNLIVDEDGLAGANVDSAPLQGDPGETNSTENAIGSGTVVVDFGNDVPGAPLADSMDLVDSPALDGQLVDLDGNPVTFALNGTGQLVGTANGIQVMIISISGAVAGPGAGEVTYTYQAELLQPVQHADVGNNENTDILSGVQFQVTDSDGDPAGGSFNVTVVDDVPSLENVGPGDGVTLDETDAGTPGGFPISDTSTNPAIDATQVFGADGPAATDSAVYGLAITGGPGSGLQTAIGNFAITLVQIDGDTIEGQYQDGGTQVAFTIEMNADGTVTLTQEVPLEHLVDGSSASDHNDSLDLSGLINATVTITDGDGDTATASAGIGGNLEFLDDGPNAQVDGQATLDQLVLDESPVGTETDGDSAPAGLATVQANFANNFVTPVDYGADGAGTVGYTLALSANGIGSGLFALDAADISAGDGDGIGKGAEITLSISPDGLTITGSVGLTNYFTISIDPVSGVVTFTQLANVWHANTASDDDTSTLTTAAAANVQVVQTVTDSDGDFDTAGINIGTGVFHIEDDGPKFTAVPDAAVAENGNTPPVIENLNLNIGTDGFGLLAFDPAHDGDAAVDGDGNPLSMGGEALFYQVNGNILTAETADGEIAFTITLNQNGTYTFDVNGTISNGTETSFTNLTSSAAGNVDFRGVGADDPNNNAGDTDILLSGHGAGGLPGTVNTDSDSIGIDSQAVNPGAAVRIDLVSNLESGAATTSGFSYDAHVTTTHFEQLIPQVQGSQANTVSIVVTAILADDDQVFDNTPGTVEAGESKAVITKVYLDPEGVGAEVSLDISGLANETPTQIGTTGVFVSKHADGSVTFSGLQEGDQYGFDTATDFSAVVVEAPVSNAHDLDLGIFTIGSTSAGTPIEQDFNIIAQDRDGDTETSTISTTINPPADALAATSFSSQSAQLEKVAANSNTLTMAAAVAAAGVVETQAAAAPVDDSSGRGHHMADTESGGAHQVAASFTANDDAGNSAVSDEAQGAVDQSAPAASSSHGSDAPADSGHALDDSSAKAGAESSDHPAAANDQGPAQVSADASPVAPTVAMVSAEALQAAGVDGQAQHGGSVEQVVADALGQGNAPAAVDAILDAMTGAGGNHAAIASLASPAAATVPAWDMAMHGAFGHGADMMMKMGAEMLHHDAVQPAVNG